MSTLYRKETEIKHLDKISQSLECLPTYVTSYIQHIQFTTTPLTRLGYINDITLFFEYILDAANYSFNSVKDISLDCLENLSLDFINSYLGYLACYEKNGIVRTNSRDSISRKLSSLRNFFALQEHAQRKALQ